MPSPTPGGRAGTTAEHRTLRALCREHTAEAVATILEIMGDIAARHGDRLRAAEMILDRSYGVPSDEQAVARSDSLTNLSDAELEQLALDEFRASAQKIVDGDN